MNSQIDGRGRPIVFDSQPSGSVRTEDENGYMHVAVSNITKEQVAPYLGKEIPNGRDLGFEDDEIYYGWRPAAELSRKATVESLNGVPVLLRHRPDSADDPAPNRVGSTGTDARWQAPYLTNSLHIQDSRAIDRIKDGTMREISMGYSYTPVKRSGEFRGRKYDFIMTDIICNHVALVEKGRAGGDVIVQDHALAAGDSFVQAGGNDMDEKKEAIIAELTKLLEDAGIDTEKARAKLEALAAGGAEDDAEEGAAPEDDGGVATDQEGNAYNAGFVAGSKRKDDAEDDEEAVEEEIEIDPDTDPDAEDDGDPEPDPEAAQDNGDPDEGEIGLDDDEKRQLSELGCDVDDPKVIAAFRKGIAEGTAYGERLEKDEPRKLAREHEAKGERRAMGEDSVERIATAVTRAVTQRLERKFAAMDECAAVLGRVRATAFDSADAVYRAAMRKLGVNVAGMRQGEARTAFRAYTAATRSKARGMASDSAPRKAPDALGRMINSIKIGD